MVDEATDAELVERCRNGDRGAFDRLVRRHERPVYHLALRMLRSPEDARDVVQTAFLKAWERLHAYDPQYKFFSWLYRIAVNESLNQLRSKGREEPLGDETELPGAQSANPEWQVGEQQQSRRVQAALMRMKADDRVVLTLRHFSEFSYKEIGQILGLDEKTVKSRLFEARSRLKGLLEDLRVDRT